MSTPSEIPNTIPDAEDNGSPRGAKNSRDFGATPVWVWNDGQVGGPFEFREVAQLEQERGRVPGMLGRVSGGEWMPWPDLERWVAEQASARPEPVESADNPNRRQKAIVGTILGGGLLLLGLWAAARSADAGSIALLLIIAGLAVYFLPLAVAQHRRHPQSLAIGVLNIVAGWTLLGWIVALVWACTHTAPGGERKGF